MDTLTPIPESSNKKQSSTENNPMPSLVLRIANARYIEDSPVPGSSTKRSYHEESPSDLAAMKARFDKVTAAGLEGGECEPKFEKGTTVLGCVFQEGIMVAPDRSGKCEFVYQSFHRNLVQLNSHMLATISGGSEFLLKDLEKKCKKHEQKEGREPLVAEILDWLAEALSAYKEEPLSVGILIAVWNELEHGLYRMNGYGERVKGDLLATGSGSASAVCKVKHCESFMPVTRAANADRVGFRFDTRCERPMSVTEVADLAKEAICFAAYEAPHTVSVIHLGSGGCVKILLEGDMEEWYKENMKHVPRLRYEIIGMGW
ncbi:OLC1v1015129C1 [Oldenlandia corymbosa var. corymbosa]|uniref:OLC1v1015129C1 n=1 Tax=Oldenlandia corymbosa var. corymbosa TaxID=529605 RepID=A0AAV1E2H4_OLDCO|nr:OLC1v1015129C1 [Oldenlandia corymbosa var. corymbosa]